MRTRRTEYEMRQNIPLMTSPIVPDSVQTIINGSKTKTIILSRGPNVADPGDMVQVYLVNLKKDEAIEAIPDAVALRFGWLGRLAVRYIRRQIRIAENQKW